MYYLIPSDVQIENGTAKIGTPGNLTVTISGLSLLTEVEFSQAGVAIATVAGDSTVTVGAVTEGIQVHITYFFFVVHPMDALNIVIVIDPTN